MFLLLEFISIHNCAKKSTSQGIQVRTQAAIELHKKHGSLAAAEKNRLLPIVDTVIEFEANIFLRHILQIFSKNHDKKKMLVFPEFNFYTAL